MRKEEEASILTKEAAAIAELLPVCAAREYEERMLNLALGDCAAIFFGPFFL
jgi:hypothetical protein